MTTGSPRELTDLASLKALAHPLRQRMLTRLQQGGAATSADLSVEFGVDRGAASYHLRQLARYGFIEVDDERSAGRRRYWRAPAQDLRLPRGGVGPEAAAMVQEILLGWRGAADEALRGFLADPEAYGEFGRAALTSHGALTLTAEELLRFGEEYLALLDRWQRRDGEQPPDSRRVTVLFNAFPTPHAEGPR